jgi:hypothetical protein
LGIVAGEALEVLFVIVELRKQSVLRDEIHLRDPLRPRGASFQSASLHGGLDLLDVLIVR